MRAVVGRSFLGVKGACMLRKVERIWVNGARKRSGEKEESELKGSIAEM